MALFIRPTLASCLKKAIAPDAGFDSIASWVVYARRSAAGRSKTPYHETLRDRLTSLISPGQEASLAAEPQLWGTLPKDFDTFAPNLVAAIQRMEDRWQD